MAGWLSLILLTPLLGGCGSDGPGRSVASGRPGSEIATSTVESPESAPVLTATATPVPATSTPLPFAGLVPIQAPQVAPGPAGVSSVRTVQSVTIRAGERERYYFAPNVLQLRTGTVQVRFVNEGLRPHTFNVKTPEWRDLFNFAQVNPGNEASFEFSLEEPGSYVFYCILYKHVDFGQTGQLTLTR